MARPSKSCIELSQSLHRDLTIYTLAAAAAGVNFLASSQPAAAQIVYTPAHSELHRDGVIKIDLNHDGVTDLLIREIPTSHDGIFFGHSLQAVPRSGGIKLGLATEFAAAMSAGSIVRPRDPFFAGPAVMVSIYSVYYLGSWASFGAGTPKYLGIRFQINGETHYGWARLNVKFGTFTFIDALLTGYAYESQPNKSIRAGDMGDNAASSESLSQPELEARPAATLGALALGADGIASWRPVVTISP